jgi:hypothetical protein
MSERVFYPDTNAVSSTSNVVVSIARNRRCELILSASTLNNQLSTINCFNEEATWVNVRWRFKQTADQWRDKATGGRSWMERVIWSSLSREPIRDFTEKLRPDKITVCPTAAEVIIDSRQFDEYDPTFSNISSSGIKTGITGPDVS